MARDGSPPDDPNNYSDSDPTQYANYGGTGGEAYSDYQQSGYGAPTGYGDYPPPPPEPTRGTASLRRWSVSGGY